MKNISHYKSEEKVFLKETHWYKMKSSYDGKLKPQKSEGIRSAKWKTIDQAKDIKKKTLKYFNYSQKIS